MNESHGLMPKADGCYSGSRDWYLEGVPCKCEKCPCNSGRGYCAVPSRTNLDINGKCLEAKKLEN